ncbi:MULTISPECIES: thiamine-phosphate kinase [Bacillus]|uniref:Thiamine-monophosphate kinase n=2 Tax=Bacillus TaxID=1386 RepID=A0A0M4FV22_9BACI|nr:MULTISPECIES: thiamine-phosphate kinase [Bacillus]ALC83821.1 thiamine monophosphate kinase [Bacillus gobiensis]MBP1083144.1 thiamine-monophosphate kinase [Bacillus capparidis]MED1097906.1 thiamine-phosphate kinase [Bacillus capparidis]
MDEFELISRITHNTYNRKEVKVGVGDDAAIYSARTEFNEIVCVDTMVEGIHFLTHFSSPSEIGYKALAINISDIAAMGGIPKYYLVSLAIPSTWREEQIDEMYGGMKDLAKLYHMDLLGGDTVSTEDKLIITVTAIGEIEKGKACLRSYARPGDTVFVTGYLGSSAAGLSLLYKECKIESDALRQYFLQRHKKPVPRVDVGLICSRYGRVALNDISDGLSSELNEIAEASNVTIEINKEQLPVHPELKKLGSKWEEWVLFGGEDFELAGTIPHEVWDDFYKECEAAKIQVYPIGHVTKQGVSKVFLNENNHAEILGKKGYNHFKQR